MLLTPSHVSILLTSFVIISCTTALFLSGYVIQQRTVNQLRTAIRQAELQPSPKPFLPDRFRSTTTELKDGTIVVIEPDADADADADAGKGLTQQRNGIVLEAKPTVPEHQQQRNDPKENSHSLSQDQGSPQQVVMAGNGNSDSNKQTDMFVAPRSDIERDLNRQLELDDATAASADESERNRNVRRLTERNQLNPDPDAENQKPISRAERRRLIKEEISRLSYEEEPVYYQRRLY